MDLNAFIDFSLNEDVGTGDHTSLACVPLKHNDNAVLLAKDNGIIAGVSLAQQIFNKIDSNFQIKSLLKDGDVIKPGDWVMEVSGSARSILLGERLVLNCMQHMSGVATKTAQYVNAIKGCTSKILDTRKTTPGSRLIDKLAVVIGGGENHRIGLYDMILIKDNHIDYAGGISQALNAAVLYNSNLTQQLKIEIEVRDFNELDQVLKVGGMQRIMLDNFTPEQLSKALGIIDKQYETEASGGINLETVRSFAETGVDYISVGDLTHSVKSLDLSLKAKASLV